MRRLSLEEIKNEVQQLDPVLAQQDERAFRTAVVLLAAAFATGPDTERLARFTGYPESLVAAISQRMRQCGLWTDNEVSTDHWFKGDKWTPGLWMGQSGGGRKRCRAPKGRWEMAVPSHTRDTAAAGRLRCEAKILALGEDADRAGPFVKMGPAK